MGGAIPGSRGSLRFTPFTARPQKHLVTRPLTWQGPRGQPSGAKSQQSGRKPSGKLRQIRLLHMLRAGMPPTLSSEGRNRLAANVIWQLRCIQLSSIRMNRNLDNHMNWIKVELSTMPGIVLHQVEQLVGDTQNMMRILISLMAVLFLLR